MNTQLIPVFPGQINNQSVNLVDARLLHSFLEVTRDFSTWIKGRIEEYGFIKNVDFLVHQNCGTKTGRGGNRKAVIDYHLALDMAKELSMVERNDKGRQARRYFISCEQQLHAAQPLLQEKEPQPLELMVVMYEDEFNRLLDDRLEAFKNELLPGLSALHGSVDGKVLLEFQRGQITKAEALAPDAVVYTWGSLRELLAQQGLSVVPTKALAALKDVLC